VITPFDSLLIFILGLIFGSFLNVVIYRYNTGRSIGGRSQCLACGKMLRWYELIPLFSFVFQGGKCRGCGSKISWQYPVVELATALSFFLVWQLSLPPVSRLIYLAIVLCLVVIVAYDWRHLIIPDAFVYSFITLALINTILLSRFNLDSFGRVIISHLLAGAGLAAFFWLLWLISRGRWLGFADGKLALGIGFLLGPLAGISAVILAFWTGAVVGVGLIIISRLSARYGYVTMKSELPFAPFLILGLALIVFLNLNVLPF
jgi:leader peptidase (prepilin peptidase)/N-methyltransferase